MYVCRYNYMKNCLYFFIFMFEKMKRRVDVRMTSGSPKLHQNKVLHYLTRHRKTNSIRCCFRTYPKPPKSNCPFPSTLSSERTEE